LENRKEYKFLFSNIELFEFFNYFNNGLKVIYPQRQISSIYFDTVNFTLFKNSLLNDVDKFKLRFRKYDNNKLIFQEQKINSKYGKFKITNLTKYKKFDEIQSFTFKNYLLDKSLKVIYDRKYFQFKNVRITLDSNLSFESTPNRDKLCKKKYFTQNIIEYKLIENNPDIESFFLSNPTKFSKYEEGIKKIYNLNDYEKYL